MPIPADMQDQAGWGSEHPDLLEVFIAGGLH